MNHLTVRPITIKSHGHNLEINPKPQGLNPLATKPKRELCTLSSNYQQLYLPNTGAKMTEELV